MTRPPISRLSEMSSAGAGWRSWAGGDRRRGPRRRRAGGARGPGRWRRRARPVLNRPRPKGPTTSTPACSGTTSPRASPASPCACGCKCCPSPAVPLCRGPSWTSGIAPRTGATPATPRPWGRPRAPGQACLRRRGMPGGPPPGGRLGRRGGGTNMPQIAARPSCAASCARPAPAPRRSAPSIPLVHRPHAAHPRRGVARRPGPHQSDVYARTHDQRRLRSTAVRRAPRPGHRHRRIGRHLPADVWAHHPQSHCRRLGHDQAPDPGRGARRRRLGQTTVVGGGPL